MRDSKAGRRILVALALSVSIFMMLSSVSGTFYFNSSTNNTSLSSNSQNGHIYLVTTTYGNQNHSYYEEFKNGRVEKTWPAQSAIQENITSNLNSTIGSCPSSSQNFTPKALKSLSSGQFINNPFKKNYNVNFTETGLPTGTRWYVNITGHSSLSSTSSTVSIFLQNGSYSYTITSGSRLYFPSPSSSILTVNGSSASTLITFSTQTFALNGMSQSVATSFSPAPFTNIVYSQVNSTANNINLYTLPEAEKFTVNGSSSVPVNYIFLNLSGSGIVHVSIGTSLWGSNTLSNISVTVTSGKSWYTVPVSTTLIGGKKYYLNVYLVSGSVQWGYTASPSSSSFNYLQDYWYSGSTLYHDNSYPDIYAIGYFTYAVTFTESGLASGNWYVNITNQPSSGPIPSSQTTYSTSLPNGSYSYSVSTGNKIYKPSYPGTFTVNGAQVSQSITFTEVTYSVTFTETGLPSSATWNVTLNSVKESSSSSSITFSEPNGTYSYTVGIYQGYSSSPYTGSVTVNGAAVPVSVTFTQALTASITASPTTIDLTQSTTVTLSITGGTSPYTWTFERNGSSSNMTSLGFKLGSNTFTPLNSGTYTLYFNVTDKVGKTSDVKTTVTVNQLPTVSISPSSSSIDSGQSITFTNTTSGGTQPYKWSYTVSPSSGWSQSGNTFTFTSTGTYTVTLKVTDSTGATATSSSTVTVNSALSVPTPTVSPSAIDQGQSSTLSVTVTTGTSPYTYQWYEEAPGGSSFSAISGATSSSYTFSTTSSTATGIWSFYVKVTDSSSTPVTVTSSTVTVTVGTGLVVSISPSSSSIDVGQTATLTATASGGSGSYTSYAWYYEGPGGSSFTQITGVTTSTYPFSSSSSIYTTTGTYTFEVTVTDSNGATSPDSNTVTVTVNQLPYASITASPTTIDLTQSTTVTLSITGGTSPYTWTFERNGSASNLTYATLSPSGFKFTPSVTGTYTLYFNVTDKVGKTSDVKTTVTVNPILSLTISPSSSTIDAGQSITFSNTTTGGSGSYKYTWTVSPSSGYTQGSTSSTYNTFTFTSTGTYTVTLKVTDSLGESASSPSTITVGSGLMVSVSASPTAMDVDQSSTLTASATGGIPTYSYQWYEESPGSSTYSVVGTNSQTFTFSATSSTSLGTWSFYVIVKDSTGATSPDSNTVTVTVYADPTVSVSPTGPLSYDVGQTASALTASITYSGSNTVTVTWYSNTADSTSGGTSTGTTGTTFTPSTSSSGTTYYYAVVTDSGLPSYSSPSNIVKVTVSSGLSATVSVLPSAFDAGHSTTVTLSINGGTSPFTWTFEVGGISGNQSGASIGSFPFGSYLGVGSYKLYFNVTDSFGKHSSGTVTITVGSGLIASISSYPSEGVTAIDVNHAQEFLANVEGGSGTYDYSWGLSGISVPVSTSSTYTLYVSSPGVYIIYLNVTDGTSHTSATPVTVIVNPPPKVSFGGSSTIEADVGQSVSAVVVGGTPPYQYSWSIALYPSSTSAVNDYVVSDTSIYFTQAGNYTVMFSATDADGVTASITEMFTVNSPMSSSLSISNPLSSVIDRGNSTILNVSISGGSGLFSYQWFEQIPGSNSFQMIVGAANSTYDFITSNHTVPGVYLFYVNVTDLKTDPAYVHSNIISVKVLSTIIYPVSFSETGLPSGMKWFINVTNGPSYSSSSNRISFLEPNGTYSYTVSTGNKTYRLSSHSSSALSFTVSGSSIAQTLVFLPVVYSVTFSEYGLTNGTRWFVNISNGQSFSSTLNVISFSETNGTYQYVIDTSNKNYKPTQSASFFVISGNSISKPIYFELVSFSVTFGESNLPAGTKWFVNLSNQQSFYSTKASINFPEPNGTYHFTIATVDKIFYSEGGSFTVSGSSIVIHITFLPYLYNISFVESGLPSGMKWNITLIGPNSNLTESSTGAIYFNEVNGTYNFSIGSIPGYTTKNYLITIVVDGSPFRSNIVWTTVTYPITIVENGLASGETWSVTLTTMQNGQEKIMTLNSTSNSITFNVTNGSYSYSVSLPQGYKGSPIKSTISVVGSGVTTKLTITALPNYLLIWLVTGGAAVISVVIALYIVASRKSLFKREGRFVELNRRKAKK